MSSREPSPHSRNRLPKPISGSRDNEPDRILSSQSSQGRIALVWSRELAVRGRASEAVTRLTVAAAARVSGYAGGDALHIVLAVLSWLAKEFIHACADYGRAMYPPLEAYEPEPEFDAGKPVAPAKPRLTLAASNPTLTTKLQSSRR